MINCYLGPVLCWLTLLCPDYDKLFLSLPTLSSPPSRMTSHPVLINLPGKADQLLTLNGKHCVLNWGITGCTVHALSRRFLLLTQMRWCMSLEAHGCLWEAWERMTWTRMRKTASHQPVCWACPSWTVALLTDPALLLTLDMLHPGNTLKRSSFGTFCIKTFLYCEFLSQSSAT